MLDPTQSEDQALREMAWHLRVRRDHLLQIAEGLPAGERERLRRVAGGLEAFFNRLHALAEELASCSNPDSPPEDKPSVADLRFRIRCVMRDLSVTGKTLHDLAGPPPAGQDEGPAN
jgi:hypothetical protein